jgi:hypothetical protein
MTLARMKVQQRYITEIYGKPVSNENSPMDIIWQECLARTVYVAASLNRVGVPKPRKTPNTRQRPTMIQGCLSLKRLTINPVSTMDKAVWRMLSYMDISESESKSEPEKDKS